MRGNGLLGAQKSRVQRAGVLHLVGQMVQAEVTAVRRGTDSSEMRLGGPQKG